MCDCILHHVSSLPSTPDSGYHTKEPKILTFQNKRYSHITVVATLQAGVKINLGDLGLAFGFQLVPVVLQSPVVETRVLSQRVDLL